jgi:hypothetical protein
MSAVIQLPNPNNLRAGMDAVRERAKSVGASPDAARRARLALLVEMRDGRSTAAAVALANRVFSGRQVRVADGGSAA